MKTLTIQYGRVIERAGQEDGILAVYRYSKRYLPYTKCALSTEIFKLHLN